QGIQIHRGIVYGSHARLLTPDEAKLATPGHTHRWTVFLQSAATPPPTMRLNSKATGVEDENEDFITGGADDLSWLIKRVTFRLHETYPSPNRPVDKPPYRVTETGWGEFPLNIRVQFQQETGEKTVAFGHQLRLHHWGPPALGPQPQAEGSGSQEQGASGPGAHEEGGIETARVKPEPKDDAQMVTVADSAVKGGNEPAEPPTASSTDSSTPVVQINPLPVHSWQYDQFVFTDPTTTLYQLLLDHPETPLPRRSLRMGQGKHMGEGAILGVDRGSAGVPLEFTQEMEVAERERLEQARRSLVEETDRWR
ncbi:hypothetical protein HD553DRAFT_273917, partial [Filobasidium floriforme]|uniref:uncharacterized protein n=1 Tax=Filobasidium floriforme TaxID=5210 RepID=UPI001E8D022D